MAVIDSKTISQAVDRIDRAWRIEMDSPLDIRPVIKLLVHRSRERTRTGNYSELVDDPFMYEFFRQSDNSSFLAVTDSIDKVLASGRVLSFNGDGTLTLSMEHVLQLLRAIMDDLGEARYLELNPLTPWQYWPGAVEPHISNGTGQGHPLLAYGDDDDVSWSRFSGNPGVVCGWQGSDGSASEGRAMLRWYHDGPTGAPAEACGWAARLMDAGSWGYVKVPWGGIGTTEYFIEFDGPDGRIRCDGSTIVSGADLTQFHTVAIVYDRVYGNATYERTEGSPVVWSAEESDTWVHDFQIYGRNCDQGGDGQLGDGHGLHVARLEFYKLDAEPSDAEADAIAQTIHDNLTAHVDTLDL